MFYDITNYIDYFEGFVLVGCSMSNSDNKKVVVWGDLETINELNNWGQIVDHIYMSGSDSG
jgi:hypothetical protein